jgi:hypothetical protein
MSDDELIQSEISEQDSAEIEGDAYIDLFRLLVGGIFEGGNVFLNWLDADRKRRPPSSTSDQGSDEFRPNRRAEHAAVGFMFRSAEAARTNIKMALYISETMSGFFLRPASRILKARPFHPLRNQFETLVARGEAEVEDWVQVGASEERRSRLLARDTTSTAVNDVIQYLSQSPALETLIKSQIDQMAIDLPQTTQIDVLVRVLANNYITYLNDNPDQVQNLIRSQGDTYLDHLSDNPEQVQTLIQGQSKGLIEEVRDEVRQRMVTSDSALELLARSLFRRRPRAELPEPAPEVQARAANPRLEGDFPKLTGGDHGGSNPAGTV